MEVKRTDKHQDPIIMRSDTERCLFSALTWAPTHSWTYIHAKPQNKGPSASKNEDNNRPFEYADAINICNL